MLNYELSDDPRATLGNEGPQEQGRRGPGAGGGRGPGGGGGGGRGGDRPDPAEMAEMREAMQSAMKDLMTAPRRMTVVETESAVLLTYDDGRVLRLIPDDREHAGIAGSSMQVKRRTTWTGETLVTRIELQSRMRFELEQTYEVLVEGGQLVITSKFKSERFADDEDREFRRVYDRELS